MLPDKMLPTKKVTSIAKELSVEDEDHELKHQTDTQKSESSSRVVVKFLPKAMVTTKAKL